MYTINMRIIARLIAAEFQARVAGIDLFDGSCGSMLFPGFLKLLFLFFLKLFLRFNDQTLSRTRRRLAASIFGDKSIYFFASGLKKWFRPLEIEILRSSMQGRLHRNRARNRILDTEAGNGRSTTS